MKSAFLVWAGLWRKPARTLFTVTSLAVAFLLFGLLQGVNSAFDSAVTRLRGDRLLVDPRFDAPLLQSDANMLKDVPGVRDFTWTSFLSTSYQDPNNGVILIMTDPASFFAVRNEYETEPEQIEALLQTRTGMTVLRSVATKYGWRIGDRVALQSPVARKDGAPAWEFQVVGFFDWPANPGQIPFAVGNYEYFDEARVAGKGTIGRFVVRAEDARHSVEVATAIDRAFGNSSRPTRTLAENEFAQTNLAKIGDVSRLTTAVMGAVFFAILFLAGNVVLQSVRERMNEFAVLKTLGFTDGSVLSLIVSEALVLCAWGAVIGLGAASAVFPLVARFMPSLSGFLGTPRLSVGVVLSGLAAAALLTVLSAVLPAWRAKRMSIVDALRARV